MGVNLRRTRIFALIVLVTGTVLGLISGLANWSDETTTWAMIGLTTVLAFIAAVFVTPDRYQQR